MKISFYTLFLRRRAFGDEQGLVHGGNIAASKSNSNATYMVRQSIKAKARSASILVDAGRAP
ncbi:MAG: hypothetical protein A3H35_07600 [Betaproteobacteria bacterium RIFCSPLOWO2_02_FULL_62_17]|nr:MAG: hypothetical protein A3H35_07600 [Betaproteobacteria bacterium RIFCSPLOWO2_02_FULL_62_17]